MSELIAARQDWARRAYSAALGRSRHELVTPALRRNIQVMAERLSTLNAKLRPHVKCHKSCELARLQIEAGAIGICTATVWEAILMSRSGIHDVMIANEIAGREKIAALAREAARGCLTVAVDNARNAKELSHATQAAGSHLNVVIEAGLGMGRGGVRSPGEAVWRVA